MEKSRAVAHIFSLSSSQIAPRRLDTAITTLMLLPHVSEIRQGYAGLRRQRYRIDSQLVTGLLETAKDVQTQWAIVRSPAFANLPRRLYRRLYFHYWHAHARRSKAWRWALGHSLHSFLVDHPDDGRLFVETIWSNADHRDETIALAGLCNTKYLGRALTLQRANHLVALCNDPTDRSEAALANLSELYRKGLRTLRPEVRAFLLDAETMATLRSTNPPHGRGKWSGYRFCMTNARKALARARRGRVPRALN